MADKIKFKKPIDFGGVSVENLGITTDNIPGLNDKLNAKLDLAGGIMTGDLELSNNKVYLSDKNTLVYIGANNSTGIDIYSTVNNVKIGGATQYIQTNSEKILINNILGGKIDIGMSINIQSSESAEAAKTTIDGTIIPKNAELATKEDLHSHSNKDVLDEISQEDIDNWNSKGSVDSIPEKVTLAYNLVVNQYGNQKEGVKFGEEEIYEVGDSNNTIYIRRQFQYNTEESDPILDEEIIKGYLYFMTGVDALPTYDADTNKTCFLFLTSTNICWKLQYENTGLWAYRVDNFPFPTKADIEAVQSDVDFALQENIARRDEILAVRGDVATLQEEGVTKGKLYRHFINKQSNSWQLVFMSTESKKIGKERLQDSSIITSILSAYYVKLGSYGEVTTYPLLVCGQRDDVGGSSDTYLHYMNTNGAITAPPSSVTWTDSDDDVTLII